MSPDAESPSASPDSSPSTPVSAMAEVAAEEEEAVRPDHAAGAGSARALAGDEVLTRQSVRLSAPPSFRLLDLGAVADDVVITAGEDRHMTTVYLDTADLRLVRWGCVLRHRAGEGWTVRLPLRAGEARRRELHLEGGLPEPPAAAVDLLLAYVRSARLRPVARLRTVRRSLVVRTHDGRPLAEIDDDEVSVIEGRRVAARFREVDVDVHEHSPAALLPAILTRLAAAGAGAVDPTPKLVHALGARALEPPEVVVGDLDRSARAGDVVQRAIAAAASRVLEHDAGLRTDLDPEDVHRARVATRRLRSDLRTFAALVDREWSDSLRAELAWLAGELGAVRDAEVMAGRLRERAAGLGAADAVQAERLVGRLDGRVAASRSELDAVIHGDRYVALLDRLVEAATAPALTRAASRPAVDVCPALVSIPWEQLRKAVARLPSQPSDEQLHDIRIRAKRLRYAAEAVAVVLGRRAAAIGRASAGLQEVLGDFHDAVVAAEWLRANAGRGAAAFVAGQLHAGEMVLAAAGRRDWPAAWKRVRREGRAWR